LSFIPGANIELGGISGVTPPPPRQFRFGLDINL
jgi:hypothetical protein